MDRTVSSHLIIIQVQYHVNVIYYLEGGHILTSLTKETEHVPVFGQCTPGKKINKLHSSITKKFGF